MNLSLKYIGFTIAFLTVLTWAWKVLNWVWLRPKKLEKYLRQQGFKGKSYRLLFGDVKEFSIILKKARSRPITFDDDIALRALPFDHKLLKDYGNNLFVWIGPTPRVNIMNPDQIKEIFTKIYDFQKPTSNPLLNILSTGLSHYDGEKWDTHRKIVNQAFHLEKLKGMLPAFYQCSSEMISNWQKLVFEKGSCEVDVWPELENLTSDVISRTAFGSNFQEGKRIFQLQTELGHLAMQVYRSVYIPGWRFLPTKTNKRMNELDKEIRASLMGIIKNRERAMKAGEAKNDDLLGTLMESHFRGIKEHGNNENSRITLNEVIEECKLFYLAGQATTSTLLVWTMVLLSKYQDWQVRAREEVFQVCDDKIPNFDGLNRLKVVQMIFYEVLRLYPPEALLARAIHKEIKLGNLSLPAGVQVSVPVLLVHNDPKLWGEDAIEFKPERFLEGISNVTNKQVSYFPFGWGPRICVGMNFALLEAKMAIATILQNFSFELSPSYVHAPKSDLAVEPEYGAQLILQKV